MVYLINRLPSSTLELWLCLLSFFHRHLNYSDLHTFGCVYFIHLPTKECHKLSIDSMHIYWLDTSHKGYICHDYGSKDFEIPHHIVFFEHLYFATDLELLPKNHILSQFNNQNSSIENSTLDFCPTLPSPDSNLPLNLCQLIYHLNTCKLTHHLNSLMRFLSHIWYDFLEFVILQIDMGFTPHGFLFISG